MNIEDLMTCYCKTREMTSLYSRCLDNEKMSKKDKEVIYELILNSVKSSNKLREYCEYKLKEEG